VANRQHKRILVPGKALTASIDPRTRKEKPAKPEPVNDILRNAKGHPLPGQYLRGAAKAKPSQVSLQTLRRDLGRDYDEMLKRLRQYIRWDDPGMTFTNRTQQAKLIVELFCIMVGRPPSAHENAGVVLNVVTNLTDPKDETLYEQQTVLDGDYTMLRQNESSP
jgi:hypothetical protein